MEHQQREARKRLEAREPQRRLPEATRQSEHDFATGPVNTTPPPLTRKEIDAILDTFSAETEEVVNTFSQEMVKAPAPATIYHYTDDRGLAGILESGRIRLTDIFGLNDPTELRHGLSPAIKLLNAARRDDRFEIKQFSGNLAAMLHGGIEQVAHFFVCSFSKAGNDLGQWRAYADNGRGFALGFAAAPLEQAFARANIAGASGHMPSRLPIMKLSFGACTGRL
jgi:hypothetical protein